MKSLISLIVIFFSLSLVAQRPSADTLQTPNGPLVVQPVYHASVVFTWQGKTIYVDPYGGKKALEGLASPDIILITDIHPDHFDLATLKTMDTKKTTFIVPQAVADLMPAELKKKAVVVVNNRSTMQQGIAFRAMAMYNPPEKLEGKHPKGRGNGYVFTLGDKTIYISGDTEDTPELLNLKNIDIAFVCMNMPYTMDCPTAARAVITFKPKIVYPYHYRGEHMMSDTEQFKDIVRSTDSTIEVRLRNWYAF